jgi:hypothetical protein
LLQQTGRSGDAAEQLAVLVRLAPENPALHVGLVRLLRAAGRTREATAAQAEAERRFPDHPDVRGLR